MSPVKCSVRHPPHRPRSFVLALLALGGCIGPVPEPDPEGDVARATGIPDAVHFSWTEVEPTAPPGALGEKLELTAALARALEFDPGLQAALARVRVAAADAKQARLLPNPMLAVRLTYSSAGAPPVIETGLGTELVALLARPRRAAAADRRLEAAAAAALTEALDLVAEVRSRYAGAQALDRRAQLLSEREALADRLGTVAEQRFAAGEAARVDVTTLRAERARLAIERAASDLARRDARLALAEIIGDGAGAADWELAPPAELALTPAGDEARWLEAAGARRPEILERTWQLAALGDEAAISRLAAFDGAALGAAAERDVEWAVGPEIALPLPLFDRGGAREERAQAALAEARHELAAVRRRVASEVRRSLAAYSSARAALRLARDGLVPLEDQRRAELEALYLAGQADVSALLLAQQGLQDAHEKVADLELEAALALIRLERAVGGRTEFESLATGAPTGAESARPTGSTP